MIKIKRIYDQPAQGDGKRILVDRLWPRGINKEKAAISEWLKDIAPSNELRKWFSHDPDKWTEFKIRYAKELQNKAVILKRIREESKRDTITLLYATKNGELNNAAVLRDILEKT